MGPEATFPDHFRLPPPVAELIGFEVVYAREGSSRVELEVTAAVRKTNCFTRRSFAN